MTCEAADRREECFAHLAITETRERLLGNAACDMNQILSQCGGDLGSLLFW